MQVLLNLDLEWIFFYHLDSKIKVELNQIVKGGEDTIAEK